MSNNFQPKFNLLIGERPAPDSWFRRKFLADLCLQPDHAWHWFSLLDSDMGFYICTTDWLLIAQYWGGATYNIRIIPTRFSQGRDNVKLSRMLVRMLVSGFESRCDQSWERCAKCSAQLNQWNIFRSTQPNDQEIVIEGYMRGSPLKDLKSCVGILQLSCRP